MPYYKVLAKFKGYPPNRETWGIFKAKDAASAVRKGKAHCKKLKSGRSKDLGTSWVARRTESQNLKVLKREYRTVFTR